MIEIRITFIDNTDYIYEIDSDYNFDVSDGYIMIVNNFEHTTDYIPMHQIKGIKISQKF